MNKLSKLKGIVSKLFVVSVLILTTFSVNNKVNASTFKTEENYKLEELKQQADSLNKEVDELIELKKRKAELIKMDSLVQLRDKKRIKVDSLKKVEKKLQRSVYNIEREYYTNKMKVDSLRSLKN